MKAEELLTVASGMTMATSNADAVEVYILIASFVE